MSPASSSSTSPAWLSQKQAAEALGVTERTIRRLCSDGKLGSRVQPVLGRKPVVLIDQRDVDRILAERVRPLAVASAEALPLRHGLSVVSPDVAPDTAVSSVSLQPMGEVEHFVRLLETIVKARQLAPPSPALVPHMTLREASEYSGLPAAYLVAGARAGDEIRRERRNCQAGVLAIPEGLMAERSRGTRRMGTRVHPPRPQP